ncbi:MAG TPA: Na/Pi cotransporter family protein, partial [Fibrobacter sp.]|nr:Na/Pi cotransporter family protein [Fibrobacter sp.]
MNTIAFLVGGLGLFLMGMKFMSDGLQTVAGPSLKSLIGAVTNNRILGVLVGVLVTFLVQSSSITSVMVIGFVNAELMLLKQAIGVIMGANVGTTVTGWVLVLNIGKYGMPLAGIFGLIYCFVEKETVKHTALAFLGLGLVFMGLEGMKNALEPLSESPEFCSFMTMFDASTFYGLVKCVLIGALLTAVLQSSSAMLGVTIAMAHQGLIGFESAAALVLGQNIGTTATAFLASIGTGRAARRAALFHIFFNVFGVLWVVVIFRPYLQFVQFVLEFVFHIPEPDVIKTVNGASIAPYMTASIATFHTIFNVANLFVLLPFTGLIAKVLEKLFKQKSVKRKVVATKLDYPLLTSPFAAITQSNREILLMNQTVKKMMSDLRISLTNGPETRKKQDAIFAAEAHLDLVQEEIANFLTNLLSNRASQTVANDAERQLRMSDDL